MCDHQGKVVHEPGCDGTCQGCEWSVQVSATTQGTNCVFTWTVERKNCDFQDPAQFTGTTTVACDQREKLPFYCDPGEACVGYELTLIGDPCPTPPNGPG